MVVKSYTFSQGAKLDDHTKQKHKILRQYFERYLTVRCQLPQQSKFRLAIVDGFAGGGRYEDGSPGSPIILPKRSLKLQRASMFDAQQTKWLSCRSSVCLSSTTRTRQLEFLKSQMAPLLAALKDSVPKLYLKVVYLNQEFETAYPEIKTLLETGRYPNVLSISINVGTRKSNAPHWQIS